MENTSFVSVDWGTSNFRLRLVSIPSLAILDSVSSATGGSKALFDQWEKEGGDREAIFLDFLAGRLAELKHRPPQNAVVVISGMASSAIGMRELPYAELPFNTDGSGIGSTLIPAGKHLAHDIILISGIRSDIDVMRGEETQLIGCAGDDRIDPAPQVFIFPGTHSKHIFTEDRQVINFKTYLTGEVFNLLTQQSILKASVEAGKDIYSPESLAAFRLGVTTAVRTSLLNSLFGVRTNNLFDKLNKQENFNFLSGLLIGSELKDLLGVNVSKINLAGGSGLSEYYKAALETLGLAENTRFLSPEWIDESVIRGQFKIWKTYAAKPGFPATQKADLPK